MEISFFNAFYECSIYFFTLHIRNRLAKDLAKTKTLIQINTNIYLQSYKF